MFAFLRRRRAARLTAVTFCDSCGQICTADCRATAHYDRVRSAAMTHVIR